MPKASWFEADKEGLAQLVAGRGKIFTIYELIQNAWDEGGVTRVRVLLTKVRGRPWADLVVEDDAPNGFSDLSHAFTLFGKSTKKDNPEQRGRFDLGEKLVLALCTEASIITTRGTVSFDSKGRHRSRIKRSAGSIFKGRIRMTNAEVAEITRQVSLLIPPEGIITSFNGVPLEKKVPVASFKVSLPTMRADEEGVLRRTQRKTTVEVYETRNGEVATIYELGIPVVASGDRWHVNVCQKVPLNMDRDNVTPGYLRKLRTAVLNHMHEKLTEETASESWVHDAMGSPDISAPAVKGAFHKRFGDKAVIYDPSDPEANARSASQGRPVVRGGSLSGGAWANVKTHAAALPAGQVTPSPKPFSPDGDPLKLIDRADYTTKINMVVDFCGWLGNQLLGFPVHVQVTGDVTWGFGAAYGDRTLTLNKGRLGSKWFEEPRLRDVVDLLVHELAHEHESNHLSENYYKALSNLAGLVAELALAEPEKFVLT